MQHLPLPHIGHKYTKKKCEITGCDACQCTRPYAPIPGPFSNGLIFPSILGIDSKRCYVQHGPTTDLLALKMARNITPVTRSACNVDLTQFSPSHHQSSAGTTHFGGSLARLGPRCRILRVSDLIYGLQFSHCFVLRFSVAILLHFESILTPFWDPCRSLIASFLHVFPGLDFASILHGFLIDFGTHGPSKSSFFLKKNNGFHLFPNQLILRLIFDHFSIRSSSPPLL